MAVPYVPRAPTAGVLHDVVRRHLATFLATVAARTDGAGVPGFVAREFRAFLGCGVLARGFARLRCGECGFERLIPFSCKRRGFCPSCCGRRMAERAAHLVDHVFPPDVPVRQWVLSVPHRLRYRLAYDHALCRAVVRAWVRVLRAHYRREARRAGVAGGGETGMVTALQRFGGAVNLHLHAHTLVIDGVFAPTADGALAFHPAAPPTPDAVRRVVARVHRRVVKVLAARGIDLDSDAADPLAEESLALAGLSQAAVQIEDSKGRFPLNPYQPAGGPVATTFIKLLGEHATVREVTRDEAIHLVRDTHEAGAAMVFPPKLSKQYLQGRSSEILLLTDPASGADVQTVKVLLLLMDKEAAALADPFAEDKITLREENLTGNRLEVTVFEQRVPGFALMFVLLAVVFGTSMSMHDERDWGTLSRLLVAPGGFTRILLGKLAARFVVGVGQMLILLGWGHWMFGVSLGSSPWAMLILTMAAVFAVVAAGMLVAGLARSREQTVPLGLSLVMALSAIGGLWWPLSMQPEWMTRLSPAVFTTWAMRGLNDLILRERGLEAVVVPVAVLLLYGAVVMAAGVRLFRVRHSAR